MSDFDEYLARLRSALDVNPRRAGEICAEVRSHLEERARQLTEAGMSREAAVAQAAQAFGDPQDVARRLTQANARHRAVSAPRVLLAFALASVGLISAFDLAFAGGGGPWLHLVLQPATRWAREQGVLPGQVLLVVMMVVLMAPTAVLAGTVAGPRRGWIAGLPALLWGALLVVVLGVYDGPRSELFVGLLVAVVAAPAAALMGLGGSDLVRQPARRGLAAGCAAYLLVLGLTALSGSGGGEILFLATAYGVILSLGVLGSAALWQWGKPWRPVAFVSFLFCAAFLAALIRFVQLSGRIAWFDVAALAVAAASLGMLAGLWLCVWRPARLAAVLLSTSCVALVLLVIGISAVSGEMRWFQHPDPVWLWRGLVAAEVAVALGLSAAVLATRKRAVLGDSAAIRAQ